MYCWHTYYITHIIHYITHAIRHQKTPRPPRRGSVVHELEHLLHLESTEYIRWARPGPCYIYIYVYIYDVMICELEHLPHLESTEYI